MSHLTQLLFPDGKPSKFAVCNECGKLNLYDTPSNIAFSENCCHCEKCGTNMKGEAKWHGRWCSACYAEHKAEKDAQRYEVAEKIQAADWNGPVLLDGAGNENEGYFASLDELMEWLMENLHGNMSVNPFNMPTYCQPCDTESFVTVDMSQIMEHIAEEGYEECTAHLNGVEQLKAAIAVFEKENEGMVVYKERSKQVVILEYTPEMLAAIEEAKKEAIQ